MRVQSSERLQQVEVRQLPVHNSGQIGSNWDRIATIRFYATRSFQRKGSRSQCFSKRYVFGHPKFDKPIPNMSKNIIGKSTKQGSDDKLRTRDRHQPILHGARNLFIRFLTPGSPQDGPKIRIFSRTPGLGIQILLKDGHPTK